MDKRRKKKVKLRYDRIAMLLVCAGIITSGTVYGISSLLKTAGNRAETPAPAPASVSSGIVKPISSANSSKADESSSASDIEIDAMASSSIKAVNGKKLDEIIEKRVLAAEYMTSTAKPAVDTSDKKNPTTNLPADAGKVEDMVSSSSSAPSTPVSSSSEAQPMTSSSSSSSSTAPASSSSQTAVAPPPVTSDVKFDPASVGTSGSTGIEKWKEVNSDVKAWIKIPNTNINYPIVVGENNLYYNEKDYYKQPSKNGVIWADTATKFGDRTKISKNTVLYGHNWTNYGSNPKIGDSNDVMFGQLTSFHHLNFAKQTPYIHYSTEDEKMLFKVFAVFYTETAFNYIASDPEPGSMLYIIEEAKRRSKFAYDVDVRTTDRILTLSTCTRAYGPSSDQRFVVMARLMREDEEVKEVKITDNPNHKKPSL